MKKTFRTLSLLLGFAACVVGSMTLASCGDDDDDNSSTGGGGGGGFTPVATTLEGTWKYDLSHNVTFGNNQSETISMSESWTFNTDGTFTTEYVQSSKGADNDWMSGRKVEGTWSKLGNDKVVLVEKKAYTIVNATETQLEQNFVEHNDTSSYFFKGNALFFESPANYGFFAYTRDGRLPFSGYGDYANSPVLGVWEGEDFAYDGTPITNMYELKADGTFAMTMDNHLNWSEGFAGYYLLDSNRIMFIGYYFISKMESETGDWEIQGFRPEGGRWGNYRVDGNKFYAGSFISMNDEMEYLVKQGTATGSPIGHWKSTQTYWQDNQELQEDEYWELESDNTVRHWWVREGRFVEGTMGTYQMIEQGNETFLVCHFDYWLADSGDNTNPKKGQETEPGESDYTLKYIYSAISDRLLVRWDSSIQQMELFKRIN